MAVARESAHHVRALQKNMKRQFPPAITVVDDDAPSPTFFVVNRSVRMAR
jgi:hypothetical protein